MMYLIYALVFCSIVTIGLLYLTKKAIDSASGDD